MTLLDDNWRRIWRRGLLGGIIGIIVLARFVSSYTGYHPPQKYIKDEFRRFCLSLQFKAYERDPPDNLSEALKWVGRDWHSNADTFEVAFRRLLIGHDPWGQPYVYRVDRERRIISLQSYGPNRRNDGGKGDDVYLEQEYQLFSEHSVTHEKE